MKGNEYKCTIYLRLHLIQQWVVWCQLDGLVQLLNGLPVSRGNTHTDIIELGN